jgi:hypothetical protein
MQCLGFAYKNFKLTYYIDDMFIVPMLLENLNAALKIDILKAVSTYEISVQREWHHIPTIQGRGRDYYITKRRVSKLLLKKNCSNKETCQ